jgi:hypothetical protein
MDNEPIKYSISAGESNRTYAVGDFLNAIDELVCMFQRDRSLGDDQFQAALKMYADGIGI